MRPFARGSSPWALSDSVSTVMSASPRSLHPVVVSTAAARAARAVGTRQRHQLEVVALLHHKPWMPTTMNYNQTLQGWYRSTLPWWRWQSAASCTPSWSSRSWGSVWRWQSLQLGQSRPDVPYVHRQEPLGDSEQVGLQRWLEVFAMLPP